MSADNNNFGIDYSFPGLCSLCHSEIGIFDGSDDFGRPKVKKFMANARHVDVLLSNDSKMKVMLCKDCHKTFSPSDCGKLMESEINGWYKEVEQCCSSWDQDRKDTYMKKFSKMYVKNRYERPFFTAKKEGDIKKPDPKKFKFEFDSVSASLKEKEED